MPFSQTTVQHTEEYWSRFYEVFIKPALRENNYEAERSAATPDNITRGIIRKLATADAVLAVLTDYNANVFYELGARHSLRQGTIMILEDGQRRPSDPVSHGMLSYTDANLPRFSSELTEYIRAIENRTDDSPIAVFLDQALRFCVNLATARLG
jgi:hypothetical protein